MVDAQQTELKPKGLIHLFYFDESEHLPKS